MAKQETQVDLETVRLILQNNPKALDIVLTEMGPKRAKEMVTHPATLGNGGYKPSLMGTAAEFNRVESGKVLLKHGASLDANIATTEYAMTAMHMSEAMGNTEFTQFLINSGADKKALNFEGKTPRALRSDPRLKASRDMLRFSQAAVGFHASNDKDTLAHALHGKGVHVDGKGNNFRISVDAGDKSSSSIKAIDDAIHRYVEGSNDRLTHVERVKGGNSIEVKGIADKTLKNILSDARNDDQQRSRGGSQSR